MFEKKTTIKKEELGRPGCYWGSEHTYYAKVTIAPRAEIEADFKRLLGDNVQGYFICLDHTSGETDCE